MAAVRIVGLDPGLRHTGWAVIDCNGSKITYVASGVADSNDSLSLAERLLELHQKIRDVIAEFTPDEAAVEQAVTNAGYDPYERKLLGITAMQKLLGKARFEEVLAGLIEKPQGKPTLVPESDKRPALAFADFTVEEDNNDENEKGE